MRFIACSPLRQLCGERPTSNIRKPRPEGSRRRPSLSSRWDPHINCPPSSSLSLTPFRSSTSSLSQCPLDAVTLPVPSQWRRWTLTTSNDCGLRRVVLCRRFSQLRVSFTPPARSRRGQRRRVSRAALKSQRSQADAAMVEEGPVKEEEGGVTERVAVEVSGKRTVEGSALSSAFTFGLNAVTRALETAMASPSLPLSSPFTLLLVTSSHPPSLTSHLTHFSHHLNLPILTLHSSVSSAQFAPFPSLPPSPPSSPSLSTPTPPPPPSPLFSHSSFLSAECYIFPG